MSSTHAMSSAETLLDPQLYKPKMSQDDKL